MLANVYLERGEPEKCLKQVHLTDSLAEKTGYLREHYKDAALRGLAHAHLRDAAASDAAFDAAMIQAKASGLRTEEADVLDYRAEASKKLGNPKLAKQYREASRAIRKEAAAAQTPSLAPGTN
jgi:hypothetical protein